MDTNRLHVLVSPAPEGCWIAHVLEFDQAAQAATADEAIALVPGLVETLRDHLRRMGHLEALWFRAPDSEWQRFDRARKAGDPCKLTTPVPLPGGKGNVEEYIVGRLE